MNHTLSLIESEKRRCEMTLEELQKRGQSPAIQDYYKELVDDYSSAIKILNDKRNVARGEEKSCRKNGVAHEVENGVCIKCGEHYMHGK